ncbi:DUF1190 family protein [Photobacterium swingsii]|uniref:DUF1190 domain-containing protein n=1 Tax=Photobacterium swingsii TaxID=680026 RepID=A0A0J8V991_9GAMM|nr:DUF1190 family protein [Photobacterium swingsii]KMV29801.1 hypothetical protein AB733_16025 [Photobacterium swingsii]PSW22802.1 DUF1190 domain-containing protein [Photobacterium swingsii]
MKRSERVVLASMRKNWRPYMVTPLTAVFAGVALTGCSDNSTEAEIYHSLDDCISDNPSYTEQCQSAYQFALQEASRTAPKYQSMNDCVAEFGSNGCMQSPGNNWFMPAMAGFMFARMMDNNRGYYSQPMFRSYYPGSVFYDRWTTADGYDYGRSSYRKTTVRVGKDQMKPKATTSRTISRGGFGSSVSAKSGWSSSKSSSKSWGG